MEAGDRSAIYVSLIHSASLKRLTVMAVKSISRCEFPQENTYNYGLLQTGLFHGYGFYAGGGQPDEKGCNGVGCSKEFVDSRRKLCSIVIQRQIV